jgi:hypothetical protein
MGLKLNIVIWCESIELKKGSVQTGLRVGFFYRGGAESGLREGYFKVIEIPRLKEINITYYVIYRKELPLSANGRDVLTPMVKNVHDFRLKATKSTMLFAAIRSP